MEDVAIAGDTVESAKATRAAESQQLVGAQHDEARYSTIITAADSIIADAGVVDAAAIAGAVAALNGQLGN